MRGNYLRRPKKKSRRHRAAFKFCSSAHFRMREQPACGSTALNKKSAASAGEVVRYEPYQQKSTGAQRLITS